MSEVKRRSRCVGSGGCHTQKQWQKEYTRTHTGLTEVTTYNATDNKVISIPDDIARFHELGVLEKLLIDRTTGKNILWATDAYSKLGEGFESKDAITPEKVTGANANNIRRRSVKNKDEKNALTRAHAEVFTPAWIVELMVDEADAAWSENERKHKHSDGWQKYVASPRLEITCGEAPFLVNRYDAADGSVTPLNKRTGILSRKLALVNENTKTRATWLKWATTALQSIYGYEFQGDNLLIARVNMLCTMEDYLEARGYKSFTQTEYACFAEIVSWNLWQMDGLTNCVPFGIAKKEAVQKSLFDSINETDEEELYGDCVIFDWKNSRPVEFASIRKGSNMKFDYVIGNPPYQEEQEGDNETYSPPVYHRFMDGAYKTSDKVELITPARFLFNAGSTPKAWNKKMLEDPHLTVEYYEPDSSKVFPGPSITGGIVITYRDETKDFGAIKNFVVYDELQSIVEKVENLESPSLASIIFASESYKFTDEMHRDHPEVAALLSKGHKYDLKTSVLKSLNEKVLFKTKPGDDYVPILGLIDGKRAIRWIKRSYISGPSNFDHYKIFLSESNGGAGNLCDKPVRIIGDSILADPGLGHTQTFISIGSYSNKKDAEHLSRYLKTRFCRVLLGVLKRTQHNPRTVWKYVPLQDFTSNSDIDWSQSVAEIDVQLYKKYGLSPEEIEFIETHVKAMD